MKIGMETTYLTKELLTFALSVIVYHDGEFDIEEVKQKIIKALEKERLECRIEEIEAIANSSNIEQYQKDKTYK